MIEEQTISDLLDDEDNGEMFWNWDPNILQVALILRNVPILRQYTYLILDKFYKESEPNYVGFKWGSFYMKYYIFIKSDEDKTKILHNLNEDVFLAAFNAAINESSGYFRSYMYKLCSNVNHVKFDEMVSLETVTRMKEIGSKMPMPSPSRLLSLSATKK